MWSASRVQQIFSLVCFLYLFSACPTVGPPQPVGKREMEITTILREVGARVSMEGLSQNGNVTEVNLAGSRYREDHLELLMELPNLRILSLAKTRVTPAGLNQLKNLRQLRSLNLYKIRLYDSKQATLDAVDLLRKDMPWCNITD